MTADDIATVRDALEMDHSLGQCGLEDGCETCDALAALARLEAENTRLREALERIAHWDCLNPPATWLCDDFPWLKRHVDAALRGEAP